MMEDIHIPDGIAVKLLLAGLVIASGAVGALGLAPATSQGTAGGLADGHSAQLAFPIDNVSASAGSQLLSLDGKGNDPYPTAFSFDDTAAAFPINNVTASIDASVFAFPIDNITLAQVPAGVPSDASAVTRDVGSYALALGQDMDPYALGQDMDPYALALGQDMDPY